MIHLAWSQLVFSQMACRVYCKPLTNIYHAIGSRYILEVAVIMAYTKIYNLCYDTWMPFRPKKYWVETTSTHWVETYLSHFN